MQQFYSTVHKLMVTSVAHSLKSVCVFVHSLNQDIYII